MIRNAEDWKKEYKKDKSKIWIRTNLSNGEEIFFTDYSDWYKIQEEISSKSLSVSSVKLQYRSNVVEHSLEGYDGVYLIRSVLGTPGGESIQTLTIGGVEGNLVHKKIWMLPGLVNEDSHTESIDNCFKEALVRWR